ncbi:MAG: polyprenyl synthetase family protein [Candidatus Marsarchaeota archaeon]|jgi:geranylgeranyl pyrophosphate synthase|nr:polyprenyl synthetase family protein [Candidatus Marsarchaeota archaeon]MCL5418625.1 polyprenyl synthetase family protein [Candidatus Marsarchaeota archaeon]
MTDGATSAYANFKAFIAAHKEIVYGAISKYIQEPKDSYLKPYYTMVRAYVDRKGQYRRPSYVLLWSLLHGGSIEDALLPAAAQQVSEDWLLMLDDFMDDNSLRRGGPTAHVMFGPAYAVNAGSHLHAINWRIVNDAVSKLGGERGMRYFNKFYDMINVTHEGQYRDLHLTKDINDITNFTKEDYYNSIHAKSAYYTVYGPMQAGAITAGADDSTVEAIKEYGTPVGNAFQVVDDILDCTSTEAALGKSIGTDVRDGVKTIILWHAVQNASTATLERLREIYAKKRNEKTDGEIRFVLDTFNELGSIAYAQGEAERLASEGLAKFNALSKGIPESNIKEIARDSITYVAKRKE